MNACRGKVRCADLSLMACADAAKTDADFRAEEEAKILAAQSAGQKALMGAEEAAKGIVYTDRMSSSYGSSLRSALAFAPHELISNAFRRADGRRQSMSSGGQRQRMMRSGRRITS